MARRRRSTSIPSGSEDTQTTRRQRDPGKGRQFFFLPGGRIRNPRPAPINHRPPFRLPFPPSNSSGIVFNTASVASFENSRSSASYVQSSSLRFWFSVFSWVFSARRPRPRCAFCYTLPLLAAAFARSWRPSRGSRPSGSNCSGGCLNRDSIGRGAGPAASSPAVAAAASCTVTRGGERGGGRVWWPSATCTGSPDCLYLSGEITFSCVTSCSPRNGYLLSGGSEVIL